MSIRQVIFNWDDSLGECYDCGRPAAFFLVGADGNAATRLKMCAVCAANYAADGETVTRIESDEETGQQMTGYYDRQGNPITYEKYIELKYAPDQKKQNPYARVAYAELKDYDCSVSTVWLGLDHGYGDTDPVIFETLVFGGRHDGKMNRYTTELDALRGHVDMVDWIIASEKPLKFCGEIEYDGVHSDICHGCVDGEPMLLDSDTRQFFHDCLDEWLDHSEGKGIFYLGDIENYMRCRETGVRGTRCTKIIDHHDDCTFE